MIENKAVVTDLAREALAGVLQRGGYIMRSASGHLALVVPGQLRQAVEQHRDEVLALLEEPDSFGGEVARRVDQFRTQIVAWKRSRRRHVPTFRLPLAPAPRDGACVSCGVEIGDGWRCNVCEGALHIALDLPLEQEA
jgi:hypothetical protein